jgi:hypothetical protein
MWVTALSIILGYKIDPGTGVNRKMAVNFR